MLDHQAFPNIGPHARTSDPTMVYNCHAWAMDDSFSWWEPVTRQFGTPPWVKIYWPSGLPLDDYGLTNFMRAFATRQFEQCANDTLEEGVEKIALYANAQGVTHTARQLPGGTWTSKMGTSVDMEHAEAHHLEGPTYGQIVMYMQRKRQAINTPLGLVPAV